MLLFFQRTVHLQGSQSLTLPESWPGDIWQKFMYLISKCSGISLHHSDWSIDNHVTLYMLANESDYVMYGPIVIANEL